MKRSQSSFFAKNWFDGGNAKATFSFLLLVAVPTIFYFIYLLLIASPQYESSFRIQIKTPGANNIPSFGQILGVTGVSTSASDNGYAVTQYLESRDAITDLDKAISLQDLYSYSDIDFLSQLPVDATAEQFHRYWRRHLDAHFEGTTNTVVVTVSAFSPSDAFRIANASLQLSETLLNKMTDRARSDSVYYAEKEVREATRELHKSEQALYVMRSRKQVIDAGKQVSSEMARIAKLQETADRAKVALALSSRYLAPQAPQRKVAQDQADAAQAALLAAQMELASNKASPGRSLAATVSALDQLEGAKLFSEKRLQNALAALSSAQADAARQQLYLDTIVKPRLPEEPSFPRPLRDAGIVFFFLAAAWAICVVIGMSVRDHIQR